MILVVVEHDRGTMSPATWEALAAARAAGEVHALTIGESADVLLDQIGNFGATVVHQVHGDVLSDYSPEAWGAVVAQAVTALGPTTVLATGTDRGNEVMAHAAARLDLPMVANVVELGDGELMRVRWGGSLLERCRLDATVRLITIAHHAFAAEES
ncbi:MAG: electron transfer flavoprotein alpha subunit, partial [Ilumatobacteraceae bacterium]|nr:electron transfer flavoprotein alpha subunit [Ilumatobacteraceae bacterium]